MVLDLVSNHKGQASSVNNGIVQILTLLYLGT